VTVAPLPRPRIDRLATTSTLVRKLPSQRSLVSRRRTLLLAKLTLPMLSMLLLASLALWPQISSLFDGSRIGYRPGKASAQLQTGRLLTLRYHGLDTRNRPYTVTADEAEQIGPERVNLVSPKGDVVSENGSWTYVEAQHGVYQQHAGLLDLSGNVVLYRDNGVTLYTQSAAMDMKQGAGAGNQPTHAEGPFGTLDAQGFALVDKGAVIQFDGKSRLLLNGTHQ
jgi:lipopolysaccharide export system protein LptC